MLKCLGEIGRIIVSDKPGNLSNTLVCSAEKDHCFFNSLIQDEGTQGSACLLAK